MADSAIFIVGFALIVLGILLVIAATVLAGTRGQKGNSKARTAGVVIVGPVPIVFGNDKKMLKSLLVLAVVLTALALAVMLVYYFLLR